MCDLNAVPLQVVEDPKRAFSAYMAEKGFVYFEVIADGEIHRFDIEKSGDKAGWYILFIDGQCPAGAFGSWKTSEKYTWSAKNQSEMTKAERKEFKRQMDETKKKRVQKKARLQEEARQRVARELDAARPAGNDHPYLQTKKVPSYGLKKNAKDQLMIPARDNDDVIWSVQYISRDGDKKFEKDGAIKGNYFTISGNDKIYICEGYATGASIHEATDGMVIVAFFAGNLKQVAQNIKTKYPNREIVICADNDQFTEGNPGVTKAKEAVAAIGARYVVPEFENLSVKSTDFNDLAHLEGIQAVKSQIFEQLEKQPVRNDRTFKLIHNSAVQLKCPEWLIDGAIEKDALALVFGDPESAKSFLAMDIACSVATGEDFHGRKVKQGPCHYIAGEGFNGLKRRLTAWQIYHGINVEKAPLFMSPTAASLCDEEQSEIVISAINETAIKCGPPALIIIDTVARNFGTGDENSTKDMTAFISAVDNIRYATGNPTVLLVHHTGHAEKGRARGSMALKGALDAEYRMIKDNKHGVIRVDATKMKDAEKPDTFTFELRTVELGLKDESGHEVTSAVLHSIGYENMPKDKYLSSNMEKAITLLRELYAKCEKNLAESGCNGTPPNVSKKEFWDACKKKKIYSRRDSFNRALEGLAERNYTTYDDNNEFVYPTEIYIKYYNPDNQV